MANKLILCEGETDVILLSYFLGKTSGWEYASNAPKNLNIHVVNNNSCAYWYKRGDDRLLICGVGGNCNFGNFFRENILEPIRLIDAFESFVVITDMDQNSIKEIEDSFSEKFFPIIKKINNRQWHENIYHNSFGDKKSIQSLLVIIPKENEGALETVLLKAISEDKNDSAIVGKVEMFVEDIRPIAQHYINSVRMEIKSKLSITLAIKYPEKTFKSLNKQLSAVAWEKYRELYNCFGMLTKL